MKQRHGTFVANRQWFATSTNQRKRRTAVRHLDHANGKKKVNMLDYCLYALAGGVLVTMSFSFLLWLRY